MSPSHAVLHATDFSAHSDLAFALACSLARASGSRLLVLHVMPVPLLQAKRYYREEMEAALRHRQAEGGQVAVEQRLEEGEAAYGILRVAQESQCDLIVMGTHGRTGLSRLLMGSVAEKVVRNAPCAVPTATAPVGAVAPTKEPGSEAGGQAPTAVPIRTILHPTDFSDPSEEAFRVACWLAEDHAARLIVVHVADAAVSGEGMAAIPPLPEGYRGGLEERLCRFQLSASRVRLECRVEEG
jgi:nucleotide-binding universal stress UspA family protein